MVMVATRARVRPRQSPTQTAAALEARVLALRAEHPTWGPRKLRVLLEQAGVRPPPAASTLSAILQRNGQISPAAAQAHRPEHATDHKRFHGHSRSQAI